VQSDRLFALETRTYRHEDVLGRQKDVTEQAKNVVTLRYRGVTKTGEGDWSQSISFIVK
jgi:hypothetical protein